jgi:outer membrane receptor protein involved in Fe transport
LATFCFCLTNARAQSTTDGAIGGTVFDPSDAAVANATVLVHCNETAAEKTYSTDDSGYFRATELQPGTYSVTITAAGFKDLQTKGIVVEVGRLSEIRPQLTLGSASETLTVTSQAPEINFTSPDFAPVVNQMAIDSLPINGRRWSTFASLTPGVVANDQGFGLLSFRGISVLLNNNTVDGADNNQAFFSEERGRTRAGYSTTQIAVEEFQVNTSNYAAEYGRAAGGVVNTVTKSGGNDFHGELFFYDRDNSWGAFNNFTKVPVLDPATGQYISTPIKPTDWRKQWGLGIGGPILKDRVFFFFAYDQYRHNFPGTSVASNPAAFFALPSTRLPTGLSCADINSTSDPNYNNDINACRLQSRLGLATYAQAQQTYVNDVAALTTLTGPTPRTGDQTIFFPKLDWQINERNHASFSFNRLRWKSPAGLQTQATNTNAIRSFGNDYVKVTWGVAKLDTFITSDLVNQFRTQYGRDFEYESNQTPTAYEQQNLVTSSSIGGIPPDVFITNGFNFGTPTILNRGSYPDESRTQFADTITWVRGNHTMKFGADLLRTHDSISNLRLRYGSFSYLDSANSTGLLDYITDLNAQNACGGNSCYNNFQQAFGPSGARFNTNDYAAFAQDDWKLTPRLSLNFGLRYEYEELPHPIVLLANTDVPQSGRLPADHTAFGPRFGFAYDFGAGHKTVLRGGYGMYYGRLINQTIYSALISTGSPNGQNSYFFKSYTPGAPAAFPQVLSAAPVQQTGGATAAKANAVYFDPNFRLPQVNQADLILERDLGWNTVLQISWLGSFGRHLPDFVDTNFQAPTTTLLYTVHDFGFNGPLPEGAQISVPLYSTRANPNYGSLTDIFSGINSSYNAGVLQLNHRFAHHFQFSGSFTWSHAIDYGQNEQSGSDTNDLYDPTTLKPEHGNSIYDIPKRLVLHAVVRSWWHYDGVTGFLLNGFSVAPIYQQQDGSPYSATTTGTAPGGVVGGINGSGGASRILELGRNNFRRPAKKVADLRVSKNFTFSDRYRLELFAEAFNIGNHQNYTGITTTAYRVGKDSVTKLPVLNFNTQTVNNVTSPLFGRLTNSNSNFTFTPRQVQLAARFYF